MSTIKAGTLKRVHVDRHAIAANKKALAEGYTTVRPPLTVQTSSGPVKASRIEILDTLGNVVAVFMYRPDKPLGCGAVAWVETRCAVIVHDETVLDSAVAEATIEPVHKQEIAR